MKRIGYLYEKICSIENCKKAIVNASKRKRHRKEVKSAISNIDEYALKLRQILVSESYQPSPYRELKIIDGAAQKTRLIQVPEFWPDQCVHHALMNVLSPIIMRRSYYWTCGSMPNRGTKRAMKGVQRATLYDSKYAKYCAKLDISKFYQSIPQDRLRYQFARLIKDKQCLRLIDTIIGTVESGLPIGNYTSAWFANFYLAPLDVFIKAGQAAGGLAQKHYVRYIDDIVICGNNKKELHRAVRAIITFVTDRLGLVIKGNWQVFLVKRDRRLRGKKTGRPIDFVGFCFCIGYTTLRKRNALALMRRSRRIRKRISHNEYIPFATAAGFLARAGQAMHCDSFGLQREYINTIPVKALKEVIRIESKRKQRATGGIYCGAAAW